MPKLTGNQTPKYRRHRASGQAIVTLNGRDHYLGPYGSAVSRDAYDRIVGEWLVNGRRISGPRGPLTITDLVLAYRRHVESYYVKDGCHTSEVDNIRRAMQALRKLYGQTDAADFGPLALKTVREAMLAEGWTRQHINSQINRVRRMFRWASENELLPIAVYQALKAVPGLLKGRTTAREPEPIRPVGDATIEATLPHLQPTVAAMVRVQRLTGMRSQEVTGMKASGIDRTDPECWVYRPDHHKTEHHGRGRVVHLGPKAIAILTPLVLAAGDGFLFSPARSEDRRNAEKRAARKTPRWPSHCKRKRKPKPTRKPRDRYSTASYRRAVARACDAAGVPHWHPHQIRHTTATEIRRAFGLEASGVVLGHAEIGTTQIYAERDLAKARDVMRQIG